MSKDSFLQSGEWDGPSASQCLTEEVLQWFVADAVQDAEMVQPLDSSSFYDASGTVDSICPTLRDVVRAARKMVEGSVSHLPPHACILTRSGPY